MHIRYLSTADDRNAISRIYEESWKTAYQGIIPKAYLESIPSGRWASKVDLPDRSTLVCLEQGKIIGTGSFGASRFPAYPNCGEIISLYLLPSEVGKGYGKALLSAMVSELQKQHYPALFLWVLEENDHARTFYEHFGFRQTDDILEDCIGGKTVREMRYVYDTEKEQTHGNRK